MKLCSSGGLPVLAASAVVALALLISPPAMAEDANPPSSGESPVVDGVDSQALILTEPDPVDTSLPTNPPSGPPATSAPSPGEAQQITAGAPDSVVEVHTSSDAAAPVAQEAHQALTKSEPQLDSAPTTEAGPAPDVTFQSVNPAPGERKIFRTGDTTVFGVTFDCASEDGTAIARCFLLDHDGNERRLNEVVTLPAGSYEWVGTVETTSGQQYRTVIPFSVEPLDVTAPIVTSDWDLEGDSWTNQSAGMATAVDPETGINYVGLFIDGLEFTSTSSDRIDFSLPDGVYRYWFSAVNGHDLVTLTREGFRKIDTVAPSVSVKPFGTVVPDDGGQAFGDAARAGRVEVEYRSSVALDYECDDERSGVASCSSPVVSGGLLDTSAAGEHVVTVTAVDEAGNRTEEVVRYFVVGGPTPQDGSGGPTPQDGSGAPVVTDQGGQGPNVTGVGRRSVVGAADADALAATGADAWQIAVGSAFAVALLGGGVLLLLRRRTAS